MQQKEVAERQRKLAAMSEEERIAAGELSEEQRTHNVEVARYLATLPRGVDQRTGR